MVSEANPPKDVVSEANPPKDVVNEANPPKDVVSEATPPKDKKGTIGRVGALTVLYGQESEKR